MNDFELGVLDVLIETEIQIGMMRCPRPGPPFDDLDQLETSRPSDSGCSDSPPAPTPTANRRSGSATPRLSVGALDNQDRWEIVRDEASFLVEAGLRDPKELAQRLGFSSKDTMDRFFYRYALPMPYRSQEVEPLELPKVRPETADRSYEHLRNTPEQIVAAARTVCTHERGRPDAVPELLAMLGLPTEPQLTPS